MPLKVLIASVEFMGPNAAFRRQQAERARRVTKVGDFNVYGELVIETEPGHEVIIPKEDFFFPIAAAVAA